MVSVEELGVPDLLTTIDAGIKWVSLCVPLQGRGMEDIGEVKIFLARDIGQVCLSLVHGLGKTKFSKMFLQCKEKEAQTSCIKH